MKTLHDDFSFLCEALDSLCVNNYVSRSDGLVLIESPDMQLMNRFNTRDLILDSTLAGNTLDVVTIAAAAYHLYIMLHIVHVDAAGCNLE